jgi:hypothetical protein
MRKLEANVPALGVRSVVIIIALALLLPQGLSRTQARSDAYSSDPESMAALGYARLRLWIDFLDQRSAQFPGRELPPPSLTEYRQYLRALGLRRRGDIAMLIVIPALAADRYLDRLRIELDSPNEPIRLSVLLQRYGKHGRKAGSLAVGESPDGSLQCSMEDRQPAQLWSLWPVHPHPLLP